MKADPTTDAELFDLIHQSFGIGDYDADLPNVTPWHKVRVTEIAKIKAIRKKRNYSIAEMTMLVRYVHRRGYRITRTWDLLQYWYEARRDQVASARPAVEVEIDRALEIERARPDGQEWVDRFLLAQGSGREVALQRWRAERDG